MSTFEKSFLDNYLKFGLGSMPKSDIDALVMYLLDTYGFDNNAPLNKQSNQSVSELLKTPVTKVKKLRYEATLKFGEEPAKQAKIKMLEAIKNASFDADGEKICLIIEDVIAKNWLQGQLKMHQHFFDNSFNSEIIKVPFLGLMAVLEKVFQDAEIEKFKSEYESIKVIVSQDEKKQKLKDFMTNFVISLAGGLSPLIF